MNNTIQLLAANLGLAAASEEDATSAIARLVSDLEEQVASLRTEAAALRGRAAEAEAAKAALAALRAEHAEAELLAVVDAAVRDLRLPPARREAFLNKARARGGAEYAREVLEDLRPVFSRTPIVPASTGPEATDEHGLTPRQRAIASEYGTDPRTYAQQLQGMKHG